MGLSPSLSLSPVSLCPLISLFHTGRDMKADSPELMAFQHPALLVLLYKVLFSPGFAV